MEKRNLSLSNPLLVFLGVFLVTFLLAFVVITRWLWPVEWSEAAPRNLDRASQEQWLRLAIDSYAANQDAAQALQRYADLGSDGPALLAEIQLDPDVQSPADIAAFSEAVGAQGEIPAPPGYPIPPAWQLLAWLFGLLFLVMLGYLIYQYWRGRQSEMAAAGWTAATELGVEDPELARPPWEAAPEAEEEVDLDWPDETFAPESFEEEKLPEETFPEESFPGESEEFGVFHPEPESLGLEEEPLAPIDEFPVEEIDLESATLAAGEAAEAAEPEAAAPSFEPAPEPEQQGPELAAEPEALFEAHAEAEPEAQEDFLAEAEVGLEVEAAEAAPEGEALDDELPDWLANIDFDESDLTAEGLPAELPGGEAAGWVPEGESELPDWLADLDPGAEEGELQTPGAEPQTPGAEPEAPDAEAPDEEEQD